MHAWIVEKAYVKSITMNHSAKAAGAAGRVRAKGLVIELKKG